MSEMVINQTIENTENADQKALELAQDFSYDGYQVVKKGTFCTFTGASRCNPKR